MPSNTTAPAPTIDPDPTVEPLSSEDDIELLRRAHFGASANICGLQAGYTGEGGKTIVPAEAMAKLDFRCPPRLEPERQLEKLKAHLLSRGYDDIEVAAHPGISLTTIDQSGEDLGERAVRLLLERLAGRTEPTHFEVEPVLRARSSSAPLAGATGDPTTTEGRR